MTAADQIICGYRETRGDGNYECVENVGHLEDGTKHYLVKLNTAPTEVV